MAKIAKSEPSHATIKTATRPELQVVPQREEVARDLPTQPTREAVGNTPELRRLMLQLMTEHTTQVMQLGAAVSRAVSWHEIARAQGDFLKASLERGARLGQWQMKQLGSLMRPAMIGRKAG